MDQERTQVGIAALRDAEKPRLPAGRRLTWDETEPSRKVAGGAEGLARADCSDERGCVKRAEARDGGQAPCRLILSGPSHELGRECGDAPVQLGPLQAHVLDQLAGAGAQAWRGLDLLIQQLGQPNFEFPTALCDHDAPLQKHGRSWLISAVRWPTRRVRAR